MKICILTTGHGPFDSRVFYKEAISLNKKYDITIVAPYDKEEYEFNGIKILGVRKPKSLFDRFKLVNEVVKKGLEVKADIYHFHDFEMIYGVEKIKKYLPKSKIIYDVHEDYPDMARMSKKIPKLITPFVGYMVDKTEILKSRKFDFIITADDEVKNRFLRKGIKADVIYNFTEFNYDFHGEYEKKYDAIYQGGITLERGLFKVIESVNIIKKVKQDFKMVFVGPFNESKQVKDEVFSYIKENNLENNIIFTGKVPHKDVEKYIKKSRIGIVTLLPYPKYFKNIPIKQFEYMACGIPVVGSDLPPIKQFVGISEAGIIVDPTSPEDIAKAINKILEDPDLASTLGENGKKAVNEKFNWDVMENKLLNIYKKFK